MVQIGEKAAAPEAPLEHLIACHRRIEQRLATLVRAAGELKHDPKASLAAIHACVRFMDSNGAMHTEDEEASLFPRLRPLLSSGDLAYVNSLEHQHQDADVLYTRLKEHVKLMRDAGNSIPDEILAAYRKTSEDLSKLYREHIQSEESVLFGLARRFPGGGELRAVAGEMHQRRAGLSIPAPQRTPCPTV